MSYFFQRKKYIKKESFPFFLTKISDFGVKDKKIARIFDSLHLLFENLRFSRRETKSREENVPFSLKSAFFFGLLLFRLYGSREQALWEPWEPINSREISRICVKFSHFWPYFDKNRPFSWKITTFFRKSWHFLDKFDKIHEK